MRTRFGKLLGTWVVLGAGSLALAADPPTVVPPRPVSPAVPLDLSLPAPIPTPAPSIPLGPVTGEPVPVPSPVRTVPNTGHSSYGPLVAPSPLRPIGPAPSTIATPTSPTSPTPPARTVSRQGEPAAPRVMPKSAIDPKTGASPMAVPMGPSVISDAIPGLNPGVPVVRYSLADALAVARTKHPTLGAIRASNQAAMSKIQGLNDVRRSGGMLLPDLDYRRQQSELGLQAIQAEMAQADHEVTYAVVRCYYLVVYAREQTKVAKNLVERLDEYYKRVRDIVNGKGPGVKGITKDTEDKLAIVLAEARGKLIEAEVGQERARAVLREAMGLGAESRVDAADELLPEIRADIDRDIVLSHAVSRRGEITLSALGAETSRIEVCAQWSRRFLVHLPTFANGADLHVKPIPAPSRDPDYRPGAIGLEMPDRLIGRRETRTTTAQHLAERAQEAARQARNLVALEADMTYSRWVEASRKAANFKASANAARELLERLDIATGGNLTKEEMLATEASATKAFASYNEALFDQIAALANLERVTAGGIRVNFPGR